VPAEGEWIEKKTCIFLLRFFNLAATKGEEYREFATVIIFNNSRIADSI
jgi:hypothetical protein